MKNVMKLASIAIVLLGTNTSFAQGAEIAREIRSYLDGEVSGLMIEKKVPLVRPIMCAMPAQPQHII